MQRMQARDLYDIWHLLFIKEMDPGYLTGEFRDLPDFDQVEREVLRELKNFNP